MTEFDVTTGTPVTQAKLIDQGYFYRDAFRIFRAHADDLFSVTVWGLIDGRSWRAAQAPLIFDDGLQAKPAYYGIVDGAPAGPAAHGERVRRRRRPGRERHDRLEWQQLPLHADRRRGQVPAAVGAGPPDRVRHGGRRHGRRPPTRSTFVLHGQTSTFRRDGTGDVPAWSTERTGGYDAVVHLPLDRRGAGRHAAVRRRG